jgi:hypothetical protein
MPEAVDLVGGGVVVADLDEDGLLDVFLPGPDISRLYRQVAPRVFEDVAATMLEGVNLSEASAASAADADGDGDLDLMVVRYMRSDVFLRNEGGRFVDRTAEVGLSSPDWPGTGSAWADWDRDGDLDLVVVRYFERRGGGGVLAGDQVNQLFRNLGDGTFIDDAARLPDVAKDGPTFTMGWHDLDDDGWIDLYVCNDFGQLRPSELLWNREGVLVRDDGSSGLRFRMDGMGMGVGDINGDAVEDFVFSSQMRVEAAESQGGVWFRTDEARQLKAYPHERGQVFGWGTELADLDADGDDDVVIGYGHWTDSDGDISQADSLYRQQPDGTFVDVAPEEGMDDGGPTRGLIVADVDRDGCADVVRRQIGLPTLVDFGGCEGRWLGVELVGGDGNTRAVGAAVFVEADGRRWTRTISAGSTSLFSGGPPEALFGLGDARRVDVEVRWPDGGVDRYPDVRTSQRLVLRQGRR